MELRFLGTGDAFGHGGRSQACLLLSAGRSNVLLDCGATSLLSMRRFAVDPGAIDAVVVSHFHGDHFGGIPYLILDGQFSRRSRPLTVVGPIGVEERVRTEMETAFPGSSETRRRFTVRYVELRDEAVDVDDLRISAVAVEHTPGANAVALRVEAGGATLAYSGDTAWCDQLIRLAAGTRLFVCEAYSFTKRVPYHMSYDDLASHRASIAAERVYLTHAGPELLAHLADVADPIAADGMVLEV